MSDKQFQKLIDTATYWGGKSYFADQALIEACKERHGYEPGEVDADLIIDLVLGGCGAPTGMTVAQFDEEMAECIATCKHK